MPRRLRRLLRIVAIWWASGVSVCLLVGIAYLTIGRVAFIGAGREQWAHTVAALGLSLLWTGSLQLLGLSVLGGLGQWIASGPDDLGIPHDVHVALVLLTGLNAGVLVGHPGGLPLVPVLARLPVAVELVVIVATPLLAIALVLSRRYSRRRVLALMAVPLLLAAAPHRSVRWLSQAARPRIGASSPKVTLLAVDELGWRQFLETIQGWCAPSGLVDDAVPGLSHFGSTRKQWRLLLTGDSVGVEGELFVPPVRATSSPESRLLHAARERGWRVTFAIDNALTASEQSLAVDLPRFVAPQEGAADLLRTRVGRVVPMLGWLENIAGPIEAQNPYSRLEDLLLDFESEIDRADITLLHTTYLANDLTSYAEMRALEGPGWMWKPGLQFRLGGWESRCPIGRCADARALFEVKAQTLLPVLFSWADGMVRRGSVRSGLIFADHGQDFLDPREGEVRTYGYHGWYMASDVLRVPMIPLGAARISGTGAATSWLEVGSAVERVIRGNGGALDITRIASERNVRSHFIRPNAAGAGVEARDPAILTYPLISKGIDFAWRAGWFLVPSPRWARAPMSQATVIGNEMRIVNPESVGRIPAFLVDTLRSMSRVQPAGCGEGRISSR